MPAIASAVSAVDPCLEPYAMRTRSAISRAEPKTCRSAIRSLPRRAAGKRRRAGQRLIDATLPKGSDPLGRVASTTVPKGRENCEAPFGRHATSTSLPDTRGHLPRHGARRQSPAHLRRRRGLRALPTAPWLDRRALRLAPARVLPDAKPRPPAHRDAEAEPCARNAVAPGHVRPDVQRPARPTWSVVPGPLSDAASAR